MAPEGEAAAALTSEDRAALTAAYQVGRAAWPSVALAENDFVAFALVRLHDQGPIVEATRTLRAADLYLACACRHLVPEALAAFDQHLLSRVPQFVSRIDRSPQLADEVAQLVRLKLFVGDGDEPGKIDTYGGRGPLESWVCAVALRTALSLVRARSEIEPVDDRIADDAALDDAELALLRRQYAGVFRDTVREAAAALAPEDRNLIRFYFVDRLSLQQIGAMRGVHASTIMRWLRDVRAALAADVRSRMRSRLGLAPSELESLERAVDGQVDISLTSIFGRPGKTD